MNIGSSAAATTTAAMERQAARACAGSYFKGSTLQVVSLPTRRNNPTIIPRSQGQWLKKLLEKRKPRSAAIIISGKSEDVPYETILETARSKLSIAAPRSERRRRDADGDILGETA